MKFKLDENFGHRTRAILESYHHDVCTVSDENLSGTDDSNLFTVCQHEQGFECISPRHSLVK